MQFLRSSNDEKDGITGLFYYRMRLKSTFR